MISSRRTLLILAIGALLGGLSPGHSRAEESAGCRSLLQSLRKLVYREQAFDLAAFERARADYLARGAEAGRPETLEEKRAFLEVLIGAEAERQGLAASIDRPIASDESALLALLGKWDPEKGLSLDRLHGMVDAHHVSRGEDLETPDPADSLLRRRWITGLYAAGIFQSLSESGWVPVRMKAGMAERFRALSGILSYAFFPRIPPLELTRSGSVRRDIVRYSEQTGPRDPDVAYAEFVRRHEWRARSELRLRLLKRIMNLALTGALTFHMAVAIDRDAVPVEILWTSREEVVAELLTRIEAQYIEDYGRPMSGEMRDYLKAQLEKESRRALLIQRREAGGKAEGS